MSSWVIVNKATGKAVMETWNPIVLQRINTEKYTAMSVLEYLQGLGKLMKKERM